MHSASRSDIQRARRLRTEMTDTERVLWSRLRTLPHKGGVTFRSENLGA